LNPVSLVDVRHTVEDALRCAESAPAERRAISKAVVAAMNEIEKAVAARAVASVDLRAIETAYAERWTALGWRPPAIPPRKLLYRLHVSLKGAIQRLTFHERAHEQKDAGCGCAIWRDIAGSGYLDTPPDLVDPVLLEEADELCESYRRYACRSCGSVWTEDHDPQSDPSSDAWWPR
jgi:hypothetical protein